MSEEFSISEFQKEVFKLKPLVPNCWEQSHLCDKQLTAKDLGISDEIIQSFYQETENGQKEQNPEANTEEDKNYLENGDILLDAFIQDAIENLKNVGDDVAERHRKNLLNGHILKTPDESIEQNMYY